MLTAACLPHFVCFNYTSGDHDESSTLIELSVILSGVVSRCHLIPPSVSIWFEIFTYIFSQMNGICWDALALAMRRLQNQLSMSTKLCQLTEVLHALDPNPNREIKTITQSHEIFFFAVTRIISIFSLLKLQLYFYPISILRYFHFSNLTFPTLRFINFFIFSIAIFFLLSSRLSAQHTSIDSLRLIPFFIDTIKIELNFSVRLLWNHVVVQCWKILYSRQWFTRIKHKKTA